MDSFITDPNLQLLLTPQAGALMLGIIAGLVQAARATRVDSRWLPYISGGMGIVVFLFGVMAVGAPFTSSTIGAIVLMGLAYGLGTTGVVAVAIHSGTGTTDGASTSADAR